MNKNTTFFLFALLLISIVSSAQEYTVEYSFRTYEPLVDANLLDESDPYVDGSGRELYRAIPIGFPFNYHEEAYNSIRVGQNGYVLFESGGGFKSFINVFECRQMNFQGDPSLSPIYYEVSGETGDRIFKLEYVKSGFVNDEEEEDYINYQLWIYENCDVFEIHIGESSIDSAETDLFYNNRPSAFMGYGNYFPNFFYILGGNVIDPVLQTNPLYTLDSVPNSGSVYTFRNCFVSLDEKEETTFAIYPNPTSDQVNLQFNETLTGSTLRIVDLSGQTVYTAILSSTNTHSIDTDFLKQGVYIVTIESATAVYSKKLVKK